MVCSTRAVAAMLLLGMIAMASARQIQSPSILRRSLLAIPPAAASTTVTPKKYGRVALKAVDSPTTLAGLQDVQPTLASSTLVTAGHYLAGAKLLKAATLPGGSHVEATYTQTVDYSTSQRTTLSTVPDVAADDILELAGGVTVDSSRFFQQDLVWMLDTNSNTAYKLDTSNGGIVAPTSDLIGVFQTRPTNLQLTAAASVAGGTPYLVAVDSAGAAWIGHTTNAAQKGSVIKVLADCTGAAGTWTTGAGVAWTDGTTQADGCVTKYVVLPTVGEDIRALAIDGGDNLWILAANENTGSQASYYLSIYMVASAGTTAVLKYGPLVIPDGANGSPGGNGAVVDKWGYLWTGSGTFLYDSADLTTYSVMRFSTNDITEPIRTFKMTHEINRLSLDADSNLWAAGGPTLTKILTNPKVITDDSTINASPTSPELYLSTAYGFNDLVLNTVAVCGADVCCLEGHFDAGIAITREATNVVFVASTCALSGMVVQVTNAVYPTAPTINTTPITGITAATIQTLAVDRTSNVWVSTYTDDGLAATAVVQVIQPATVAAVTVTIAAVTAITGGIGDLTGYITAQPTQVATYTYSHDTGVAGYDKWSGARFGWWTTNGTCRSADVSASCPTTDTKTFTVQIASSATDTATAAAAAITATDLSTAAAGKAQLTTADAILPYTFLAGRYLAVVITMTRTAKIGSETGPQGFGQIPVLTELRMKVYNHEPKAICTSASLQADATTCAATNPDISLGSTEFDLNEGDAVSKKTLTTKLCPTCNAVTYTIQANNAAATTIPPWTIQLTYPVSTVKVFDYIGKSTTCTATVAIWDDTAPVYTDGSSAASAPGVAGNNIMCSWPPNFKYYCLLDVFAQAGGAFIRTELLPIKDNCGTAFKMIVGPSGFACSDSDPRSQPGDCVLTADNSDTTVATKYNWCVNAQRRTTYTNTDRVYTMTFKVKDAGAQQGLNLGTTFTRTLKVPPIWSYNGAIACPRATYDDVV